ncbi:MAG: diacylglycerol kinase family protein [Myxococcota bacterium]
MEETAPPSTEERAGRLRGRIGVVLNPNARKNRRRPGRVAALRAIVGEHGVVHETPSLEALRSTLRELVSEGASYLVSDGGDGALNWMYNELEALSTGDGHGSLPPLMPTNSGTIDFVAAKVGLRGNAERIVHALVRRMAEGRPPEVVELDSLLVEGEQELPNGQRVPFRRVGFAAAVGGIGQRFFDKYYRIPDPGAASIVRVVAAAVASQALGAVPGPWPERWLSYARELFAPTRATVALDGMELPTTAHGAIHAGSFDVNLGGVFRVFPLARERRVLHLQAGAIPPWQIVRNIPRLCRGETIRSDSLWERAGCEMAVRATGEELLRPVLDGEVFTGIRALTIRPGPPVRIARV